MKANKKQIIAALLALCMTVTLTASCGDGEEETDAVEQIKTDSNTAPELTLELPELNYNQEPFTVLSYESYAILDNSEEATAIDRAKYAQYAATEDRLGVEIEVMQAPSHPEVPTMVMTSINAGSDDYQIVCGVAANTSGMVYEGYFLPVSELTHVNFDKEWWNDGYSRSVAVNGNEPIVLFGDICYGSIERSAAILFNKRILGEVHRMEDTDLFDIVLDGDWTVDKFAELTSDVYVDNGDSQKGIDDLYGVVCRGTSEFGFMMYSAGLQYSSRDEEGYPVIDIYNEKTISLVDKLLPIFKSSDTYATDGTEHGGSNAYMDKGFAEGHSLFLPGRLFNAGFSSVREMKDDWGIIPMPKYDESIDNYYSVVGNAVMWVLVPNTVENVEMVSAVAESLAYEGYHRTTPVYYEEGLKLKYSRGEDVDTQSKILDIIRNNARTDFLYLAPLGNITQLFNACYNMNSNNIASSYAKVETQALQNLQTLIEKSQQ